MNQFHVCLDTYTVGTACGLLETVLKPDCQATSTPKVQGRKEVAQHMQPIASQSQLPEA